MRLPSRVALLLGLGALSAAGARAELSEAAPNPDTAPGSPGDRVDFGGLLIRSEAGRVFFSEGGGAFQEIEIGDTAQARRLRQLLEGHGVAAGSAGFELAPMFLAGSGGQGFHWAPVEKTDLPDKGVASKQNGRDNAVTPAATKPPEQTGVPRKSDKPVAAGRG
jgi:hypothetical protein